MPTPVAHTIVAGIIHGYRPDPRRELGVLALIVVSCNLADVDFLPGVVAGDPNRYHQGATHSLTFAVMWGLLVWLVASLAGPKGEARSLAMWSTIAYVSHVFLDLFCIDTRPPIGLPVFWPLDVHVSAPFGLFMDIWREGEGLRFVRSLFQWHNWVAIGWEVALVGSVWAIIYRLRRRRASRLTPTEI